MPINDRYDLRPRAAFRLSDTVPPFLAVTYTAAVPHAIPTENANRAIW